LSEFTRRTLGVLALGSFVGLCADAGVRAAAPALGDTDPPTLWDLTAIYADDARWEQARQAALAGLPGVSRFKGTLGASADALEAAMTAVSDLARAVLRLDTYARLKADADQRSGANQERLQLAVDLSGKLDEATAWIGAEVIALGPARIDGLIAANPRLARFRFGLQDRLRRAPHTPSGETQAVLAAASTPLAAPAAIQRQIVASNLERREVTLSTGEVVRVDERALAVHAKSRVREDRRRVSEAYWSGFGKLEAALGATLNASVQGDVFNARTRRHASSLQAALFDANIPEAVYRTVIAEAGRGLPVLHRAYDIRRRALNLSELGYFDMTVPLASYDRTFTLAEMRSLTLAAVRPLGAAYGARLATATQARWMDALPRPGKFSGAYANPGAYDVHPYVLLNVSPTYAGATAFAHEWGHAMHGVLARQAQPFDTFNTPTFVQEVASTCNEQLLVQHMIRNARSGPEKLFYLTQQIQNLSFVFFVQAMRAEFEARIHEMAESGQALSGEQLTCTYLELMTRYYGPGVRIDPMYAIEWARQIQYYNAFYVFQYATALTGGVHFSRVILDGGPRERDRYLAMLSAGGSDYGYAILRDGGLDLATSAPYRTLVNELARTIDEAETLLA